MTTEASQPSKIPETPSTIPPTTQTSEESVTSPPKRELPPAMKAQMAPPNPNKPPEQPKAQTFAPATHQLKDPPPPKRNTSPVFYTVEDANATRIGKAKKHSVAVLQDNGKKQLISHEFKPGVPLRMPQELALIYLEIDKSFIVRNSLNQIVRARKFSEGSARTVTLKPHQVVVSVTQVLKPVLLGMARGLPGGEEKFTQEEGMYPREELEEFIISGGVAPESEDEQLDTVAA